MRTKLALFQHAYKANDLEPDGTCYGTEAEAQKAESDAARDMLGDYEGDDLAEAIIEHTSADDVSDERLAEIREGGPADLTDAEAVMCAESLRSYESAVYQVFVEVETLDLLLTITGQSGAQSVGAMLETGAALAQQLSDRWDGGDIASTTNALAVWSGEVQEDFPGLDFTDGEEADEDEDEESEPLDLSGGDPGYKLVKSGAPVLVTLETPQGIEHKASFATIADAVSYLDTSTTIDPVDLHEGRYGIDAPHGVADDAEAQKLATRLGYKFENEAGALIFLSNIDPEA